MKKLSTFALLAFFTLINASAQTYTDFTVNGLNYRVWSATEAIIMPKGEEASYSGISTSNFAETVSYQGKSYTVVGIADGAFSKATFSGNITLPSTITTIGSYAFDAAEASTLTLGPNVQILLEAAFAGNKITAYSVNAANPYFTALTTSDGTNSDGVLASKDKTILVSFPGGKKGSGGWFGGSSLNYTIPSSITEVGDFAFYMNSNVTSVTIPNTVKRIGRAAFYECINFSKLTIPASVEELGTSAFCGCVNVTSLTFNSPSKLEELPGHSFFYLASLKTLTLPEGVKRLGLMSFASCEALTTVNLSSTVEVLDTTCFLDDPITKIDLKNVKHIGRMAFSGCTELTSITGGSKLESISSAAFTRCNKLTSVSFPESLKFIDSNIFFRCTGITSIALPSTLECVIGGFTGCTSLQTITIPDNAPHFKLIDGVLYATTGATLEGEEPVADGDHDQPTVLVAVPTAITNKELNVPEGVRAIGYQAAREVPLTSIALPKSLQEIRGSGFGSNGKLTSVTCLAKVPPTVASAFATADYQNALVTVPTQSLDAYKTATNWQPFQHWATVDVPDDEPIVGDVDGDGKVDVSDVNATINIILKTKTVDDYPGNADVDGDGKVDVSDVNAIINLILKIE